MCGEASEPCACAVLSTRPQGLPPAGLADLLRRIGQVGARADAHRAEVIAEAERSGAAQGQGYSSTTAWVAAMTGEPVPVCRSQVGVAESLQDMPATRAAFAAGEVPESRVRLLAQAQALAPERFAADEGSLLAQMAVASSRRAPEVLAAWKRHADPHAAQAEAERLHEQRALHLSPSWSGMVHINGDLDPDGGLVVLNVLQALAEPANLDPADTRTPAQCRADALVEVCRRYEQGSQEGSRRPPRVLITIPWDTLQAGQGIIDTAAGPMGAESARRLCCDATVSRVLLDPDRVPVELSRATRVVTPSLRQALDLRDQHCTYPSCDVPARWCDAHHIIHWADGGKTCLSNLRLLCSRHHSAAHQKDWHPQRE